LAKSLQVIGSHFKNATHISCEKFFANVCEKADFYNGSITNCLQNCMNTINLKKLAEELNLAISTVSRALSDSHEISDKTKARVRALAEKRGFQPNPYASSLRQSRSKTIAVILPEIENNFFSQVMNGVEEIARKKRYHVLIYLTHENHQLEKEILQELQCGRVDGIMISVSNTTRDTSHLNTYHDTGIPIVLFDRVADSIKVPSVTTDDSMAAFHATALLINKGCKRIAFLSMANTLSISIRRCEGYLKALKRAGLEKDSLVVECSPDDEQNRLLIRKMLSGKNRPDAVFGSIEKFAINTYQICKEMKIAIPHELKVIGFSNSPAISLFDPPLSTITQPAYEIGREAASSLFKLVEKKVLLPAENKQVIPSQIIERLSTGVIG
jgi:LacI family transcriptional regulator